MHLSFRLPTDVSCCFRLWSGHGGRGGQTYFGRRTSFGGCNFFVDRNPAAAAFLPLPPSRTVNVNHSPLHLPLPLSVRPNNSVLSFPFRSIRRFFSPESRPTDRPTVFEPREVSVVLSPRSSKEGDRLTPKWPPTVSSFLTGDYRFHKPKSHYVPFLPDPAALRPVRCKRFQADMKMRAPPSHLNCNRYRAPLANSMQKYITFRVMSAAARKSERKGSKRIRRRRRRLRFTDLILKTRLCIRWKNGCTDHFSTYSTPIPSLLFRQRAQQGDPPRLLGRQDGDEPPRDEDAQHEGHQCL